MRGSSRKVANLISEDFSYKIFAFLLAFLIWLFVSHQVEYEISRHTELKSFDQLPVRALVEFKSGLQVGTEVPLVGVVLRGPGDVLDELEREDIQPFVKFADIDRPGEYTVPVKVWLADDRLKVEHLTPRQLHLELVEVE